MALLQYRAPVDYAAQQEAFRDFLENYKSFQEDTAAEGLEDLHINGDNTSDEYDFMDDIDERDDGHGRRRRHPDTEPKRKYMRILQEVADRKQSNLLIELDDLDEVCRRFCHLLVFMTAADYFCKYEKSQGDGQNLRLVESIQKNTKHYIDILSDAVDKVMPKESRDIT